MTVEVLSTAVGWRTIAGRRPQNEDAVITARLPGGRELVAIADGMGGHKAGEVASRSALETIRTALQNGGSLRAAMAEANREVHLAAQQNAAWSGMGTTVVALLRNQISYEIASVGDSRAYCITALGIEQITRDHRLLAEALAADGSSADAVRNSRWKNALTRSIGGEESVDVDVFGPFDVRRPHTVLLCTDGLHGSLSDAVIRKCLHETPDTTAAAQRLTDEAFKNGSSDNITAAVLRFGDVQRVGTEAPTRREGMPLPQRAQAYPRVLSSPSLTHGRRSWLQRLLTIFR